MISFKIYFTDLFDNKLSDEEFFFENYRLTIDEFYNMPGGLELRYNGVIQYQAHDFYDHFDVVYFLLQVWQECTKNPLLGAKVYPENKMKLQGGICQLVETNLSYLSFEQSDNSNYRFRHMDGFTFIGSKNEIANAVKLAIDKYMILVNKLFGENFSESNLKLFYDIWHQALSS